MLSRRGCLSALSLAALSISHSAAAESVPKTIGWLTFSGGSETYLIGETFQALGKLGWVRGSSLRLDRRMPIGLQEIDGFIDELLGGRPDLLIANGEKVASTILDKSRTQPLMFYNACDPVAAGIVASLASPGGQATGLVGYPISLGARWVQLLRQLVPNLARLAIVLEPSFQSSARLAESIRSFAEKSGISVAIWAAADFGAIDRAMRTSTQGPRAVVALPDPFTFRIRRNLTLLAQQTRTPCLFWYSDAVKSNALISYGPDESNLATKIAEYVNQILRGAQPSMIPVQEPVRYELAINRLIADQLGLDIPPSLVAEASLIVE